MTISGRGQAADSSPGGQPRLRVSAELPQDAATVAAAADVLEHVAEGVRARWGQLSPALVMEVIAGQAGPKLYGPEWPPRGLPMLELPEKLSAPEIPEYLEWLNYWSAAAAKVIGFPDTDRDAELLSRARRTATGGWVVRLTEASLDLDNPVHLDALARTYARFPVIGGRAAP